MPSFEEIWPSKKKAEEKAQEKDKNYNYYLDAMKNGPDLPGSSKGYSLQLYMTKPCDIGHMTV